MDTKKCKRKECNNLIAINKRSDSLYCTTLCGARDRNEKKERADKEKRPHKRKVEVNYKIISSLFKKGAIDVSIESLELLGFDFDYCTGVDDFNQHKGITKFNLFEFTITIDDTRCKIKKV
jgi:hypothetical protein